MKILILEDEHFAVRNLENMLNEVEDNFEIMAKLTTIKDSARWLKTNTPDLIFMDVNLADGSCFSLLEQVEVTAPLIFTTACNETAERVFNYNTIGYLTKPFTETDLSDVLSRAKRWTQTSSTPHTRSIGIPETIPNWRGGTRKLAFPVIDGVELVSIGEIVYCKPSEGCTQIYTENGSQLCITQKMVHIEKRLKGFPFYRIHRSCLVNINYVKCLKRMDGSCHVVLKNGDTLDVSRRKKDDFIQYLLAS